MTRSRALSHQYVLWSAPAGAVHAITRPGTLGGVQMNTGVLPHALLDHTKNITETHPNNVLNTYTHPQNTCCARKLPRGDPQVGHLAARKTDEHVEEQHLEQLILSLNVCEPPLKHRSTSPTHPRCMVNHIQTQPETIKTSPKHPLATPSPTRCL